MRFTASWVLYTSQKRFCMALAFGCREAFTYRMNHDAPADKSVDRRLSQAGDFAQISRIIIFSQLLLIPRCVNIEK